MTPAVELRLAASKIRRLADAAFGEDWHSPASSPMPSVRTTTGWEVASATYADSGPGVVAHMGTRDPATARLVADVLDQWAIVADLSPDDMHRVGGPETFALARAINRKES